jgi:hypothetical protein
MSLASASLSIFVAGLLRFNVGSGLVYQRTILATPTPKRSAVSASVSPWLFIIDSTFFLNVVAYVIGLF